MGGIQTEQQPNADGGHILFWIICRCTYWPKGEEGQNRREQNREGEWHKRTNRQIAERKGREDCSQVKQREKPAGEGEDAGRKNPAGKR
jgi:hypothetical protein